MADIRLEIPAENSILEIQYDGNEIQVKPPTMSENLTQLARKIDFGSSDGEELTTAEDKEEEEEEKAFQQPHWPFENVRNKIRSAMTEVCVLHDLLQIVKEKSHMVLDPVQGQQPENKQYLQFLSLKKSLSQASQTLLAGAERLRSSYAETVMGRGNKMPDFHIELLRLRQNWRLKKVGNTILGDLSYKSAGSSFKHTGLFEVTKADEGPPGPSGISSVSAIQNRTNVSALKVTVPAELEGSAYIFVCIKKDEEDLCSARVQPLPCVSKDIHWQEKLENAQNVLFCKELFSQLAKEAVALQPAIPHLVVGNQITATIFPGIHLLIALCHSDSPSNKSSASNPINVNGNGTSNGTSTSNSRSSSVTNAAGGVNKFNQEGVLEHSLHQLLHRAFTTALNQPLPHPVFGPVGVSKRRRVAGPEGTDRQQLIQATKTETVLEQIIRQAQHNFLRLRTMYVIDQLALEYKDPLIMSHWNLFNSATESCVRINIVTQGYDVVLRTSLVIHVYEKTLKCICRDGKVMMLSFEPQELMNLLFCQISLHSVAAVQSLARYMGWTVISSETSLGVGPVEPLGNASAVVLGSPTGNKSLVVRSSPTRGLSVFVSSSPRNDFYPSAVVGNRRWENLSGAWQEVLLDRMEGKNFLNKIELLMAALTAQA